MNAEMIEYIEEYLEGRLTYDLLQQEARARGVDDLEKEIQWVKDSMVAIEAAGLRDQLKEAFSISEKENTTKVRNIGFTKPLISIAASIILLVVAYWGITYDDQPALYSQYEFVDPGLSLKMSQLENYQLYNALTYFSEGNYKVAAEELTKIQQQYIGNDTLYYYLGASLLYDNKANLGQPWIQEVAQMEASKFKKRAEWLLVLGSIRLNNVGQAENQILEILKTPDHEFYKDATSLLKDLKE